MTEITLHRPEGRIHIEPAGGSHRVWLEPFDRGKRITFTHHETTYPIGLIQAICQVKEFGNICDEMRGDEAASYVGHSLRFAIFPSSKRRTSGASASSTSAAAWAGIVDVAVADVPGVGDRRGGD